MWTLSIAGYNCSVEYLPGKQNVIADFLSRMSTTVPEPDVNDNALSINAINSNEFCVKDQGQCNITDAKSTSTKPTFEGYMTVEQSKDKEISKIMSKLKSPKNIPSIHNKYYNP